MKLNKHILLTIPIILLGTIGFFMFGTTVTQACDNCGGRGPGQTWCEGNRVMYCASCPGQAVCGGACFQTYAPVCDGSCSVGGQINQYTTTLRTCSSSQRCSGGRCVARCTRSNPTAPLLTAPSDGETLYSNSVTFSWEQNGGWGRGCGNRNRYLLYVQPDCTGPSTLYGTYTQSVTSATFSGFAPGRYCWGVHKDNRTRTATSPVYEFTIEQLGSLDSASASRDTCSTGGHTGRLGQPNSSNPIGFTVNYSETSPTFNFEEIYISLVPTSGSCGETGAVVDRNTILSKAECADSYTIRFLSNGQRSIYRGGGTWDSIISSVRSSQENNAGTIRIVAGGTSTSSTFTTSTASASVLTNYLNTFPSGDYNVYAMGILTDGVTRISTAPTTVNENFERVDALSPWTFDLVAPNSSISGPFITSPNNFNMIWRASDPESGIQGYDSYIYSDSAGAQIRNNRLGSTITTQTTALAPPDPSNAGISGAFLGTHQYTDLSPSAQAQYTFKLFVEDNACNITEATGTYAITPPWLVSTQNSISANGGFSSFRIPDVADFDIPTGETISPLLSEFIAYSGTLNIPANRTSGINAYVTSYDNFAYNLPPDSSESNWYDYLQNLTLENDQNTVVRTNINQINGNFSTISGISANQQYVVINENTGTYTIQSNSVCDIQGLFFIPGDLIINPDVTKTNTNGCAFIVQGDVTIGNGTAKTSVAVGSSNPSEYDVIQLGILAPRFAASLDDAQGASNKWDGLFIEGFLITEQQVLQRDLNTLANNDQPAFVIEYDPLLYYLFRDDLGSRSYSIREIFD